jgi:radical SAM protein with 4Fe4S-binding SPASM domain
MTEELFDTIKGANVEVVQTSLYSMDAEIHDSITRVKGSHAKTLAALERLKLEGVRVGIGCPVMRQNQHAFREVLRYGNANNIPVSCDATIMAKENGDTGNLIHRIDRSDFEPVIRSMVDNSSKYRELLENNRDSYDGVSVETCGVGQYMLCVKSTGEYIPCPGFGLTVGNAWNSDIRDVWENSPELAALRKFRRSEQFPQCTTCDSSGFCNFCLAKFHNEAAKGTGSIPPDYCEVAKTNRRIAKEYLSNLPDMSR